MCCSWLYGEHVSLFVCFIYSFFFFLQLTHFQTLWASVCVVKFSSVLDVIYLPVFVDQFPSAGCILIILHRPREELWASETNCPLWAGSGMLLIRSEEASFAVSLLWNRKLVNERTFNCSAFWPPGANTSQQRQSVAIVMLNFNIWH